jgi:hypothetical protein
MRPPAGFHADPLNPPVRREAQQLPASEAFPNNDLPALVETRQMKTRLA